jgi:hypothetical protein
MKKFILILLATGACCALLAADFWQTKKFTEWDEKEVGKILKDSPWARSFTVETGKSGGGGGGKSGGGGGSNSNRGMGGSGGMGGGGGRSGRGGGGNMGGGNMGNNGNMGNMGNTGERQQQRTGGSSSVMVRWMSALPVKQAFARAQYGDEAATSPDAVRSLEKQETHYVVALIGLPRTMVKKGDQMKKNAVLKIKGHDPIAASDATAEMKDNGIMFVTLSFPKESHPLKAEDGEMALELKLGSKTVTQKFKLKNMVYNGKLEI